MGSAPERRLAELLTLAICLSLVAAVAPARSRDRGTRSSRSTSSRAAGGSQRWDEHHNGGEPLLHHVDPEWQSTGARIASDVSTSRVGERYSTESAAILSDVATSFGFDEPSEIEAVPDSQLAAAAIRPSGGRAPPA